MKHPQEVLSSVRPDELVCHYTTLDAAIHHILPSCRLRMGSYSTVNDPRENYLAIDGMYWDTDMDPPAVEVFATFEKFRELIVHGCKVLCTTRDSGPGPARSRGYAKPRMWAQYGDGHEGVCLVLDRVRLENAVRAAASDAVTYFGNVAYDLGERIRIKGRTYREIGYAQIEKGGHTDAFAEHLEKFHKEFFFRKDADWTTECEFRCVAFLPELPHLSVSIGDALVAVLAGLKVAAGYQPSLLAFTSAINVPTGQMHWDRGIEALQVEGLGVDYAG